MSKVKDTYNTIEKASEGIFKDRGSKFLAYLFPVTNEDEIKKHLQHLRKDHFSARHYCYAWQIGTRTLTFRANDDGEPNGTAGKPIHNQLLSHELTNVLLVVVRYFGGTLLGTSGLINAYKLAALDAIKNATIVEKLILEEIKINFSYNELNTVMRLIKDYKAELISQQLHETCEYIVGIRSGEKEKFTTQLNTIYGVTTRALN